MKWPDLKQVLGDTPFAVVGAVATRLYAPERHTRDLVVAVAPADAESVHEKLRTAGWQNTGQLTIGGSSWRSIQGEEVDVIEGQEAWWVQAISEAQANLDAQGLPILPMPYLVLMKFQSGRTIDIGDITRMLGQADQSALDATRDLFLQCEGCEGKDLEDLESLIQLGQLEMQE